MGVVVAAEWLREAFMLVALQAECMQLE